MNSDHDTRAKREQNGTDAQHDKHVMTDGGDALPSGEAGRAGSERADVESLKQALRVLGGRR